MVIIAILIIIIAAILIVWFAFPNPPKMNETIGTAIAEEKVEENLQTDIVENLQQNQQENVVVNEEQNQNIEQNVIEETPSETFEESPQTDEEKAIDIAKKDYGSTEKVKFGVEGIQADGKYIVSVRDSSTTEALIYYTVDVITGNFEKREMN